MHVINSVDGCTGLCHFRSNLWESSFSLHMVAMKGRIWLEAYEGYLRTGDAIDHWLPHMSELRIRPVQPERYRQPQPDRSPAAAGLAAAHLELPFWIMIRIVSSA